jgi:hypothetical protein
VHAPLGDHLAVEVRELQRPVGGGVMQVKTKRRREVPRIVDSVVRQADNSCNLGYVNRRFSEPALPGREP